MNQKQLVAIAPNELSKIWPTIREEVATIETPDDLIPEDVYLACKTNSAVLFFLMFEEKRVGWMVVRQIGFDLHIWQLKADYGYDVMRVFRDELMEVARNAGCVKLTYGSTREAWNKVSKQHGFKIRMVVYETSVDAAKQPDHAELNQDPQVAH